MVKIPRVSVVMSLYNSEKYLREAIDSVLSQTFTDFEFVIIDDGSTDSSASIVQSYDDPRIMFFRQKNKGLPAALNAAICCSQADFVARMDPDDICFPERLEKQYAYMQRHPDIQVLGSSVMCIDESGEKLAEIIKDTYLLPGTSTAPETPCIHPSVMFRRSAFNQAGGYPESMRYGGEDAVLFNKILVFGGIKNLSIILLKYRLSPFSMSQKSIVFNKLLREMVCKQVNGALISREDWGKLLEAYQQPGSGLFGYYLYIGKLFLRGDKSMAEARKYLGKALYASPFSLHVWLCWLSSFIPLSWRIMLRELKVR